MRRPDEGDEQRVRPGGPALQFGVGLGADDKRMDVRRVFDELHQMAVGRGAGEPQTAFGDLVAVGVVDLIAVPVSLRHLRRPIGLGHNGIRLQHRGIGTQPHGAAEIGFAGHDLFLIGHRGDHRIRCGRVEFR